MRKITITETSLVIAAGLLFTACSSTHAEKSYSASSSSSRPAISESSGADANYNSQSYSQSTQSTGQNEVIIPLHEEQLNVSKKSVPAGQVTIRKIVTTETVNQPIELRHERVVIQREGEASSSYGSANQSSSTSGAGASAGVSQSGASAQANLGSANASVSAGDQSAADQSSQQRASSQSTSIQEPAGAAVSTSGNQFQEQTYTIQLFEEQPVIQKSVVEKGRVVARKQSDMQRQQVSEQVRREDVQLDQGAGKNVELRGDFNTSGKSSTQFNESSGAQQQGSYSEPRSTTTYETLSSPRANTSTSIHTYRVGKTLKGDNNTLDDINRGSNTRGGAEDLNDFDEKANSSHGFVDPSGAVIEAPAAEVEVHTP